MFRWTQDLATEEAKVLIVEVDRLKQETRYSANHTRWIARVLRFLEQVFGQKSRYYLSFADLTWREDGPFMIGGPADPEGSWNPTAAVERRHH